MPAVARQPKLRGIASTLLLLLAAASATRAGADDDGLSQKSFVRWSFYNNGGWRAMEKSDYKSAGRWFKEAIETAREGSAKDPRLLARSYHDMACALFKQGRADEAEPLARWALGVREARFPAGSEPVAQSLYAVAMIEIAQLRFTDAETHLTRAVSAFETALGPKSPRLVAYWNDLAYFYTSQKKYEKAQGIYQRCLAIPEDVLPQDSADRVTSLFGLANAYYAQGVYEKAEPLYKDALEKLEAKPLNPALHADLLENYAAMLRQANRVPEAKQLEGRALEVRADLKKKDEAARKKTAPRR